MRWYAIYRLYGCVGYRDVKLFSSSQRLRNHNNIS